MNVGSCLAAGLQGGDVRRHIHEPRSILPRGIAQAMLSAPQILPSRQLGAGNQTRRIGEAKRRRPPGKLGKGIERRNDVLWETHQDDSQDERNCGDD